MSHPPINLHDAKALAAFEQFTDEEIDRALGTAKTCFQDWHRKSPGERAAVISKAAEILRMREDEFAASVTSGIDALLDQARREIALTADVIDYYAKNLESLAVPNETAANAMHFGVIFGHQPDSFPYFQLARMTVPNLIIGNVMVVKHAVNIPPSALSFERLWRDAGGPAGIFTNLLMSPSQTTRILDDPRMRCAASGGLDAVNRITRTSGRNSARMPMESALMCGGSQG